MPLEIAKIGRLRKVESIARAVYPLDNASPATVKAATDALLQANPQLAQPDAIANGDYVVVPPVAKIAADAGGTRTVATGKESAVGTAATRVATLVTAIGPALDGVEEQARLGLARVKDKVLLKAFAEEFPELKDQIETVQKGAASQAEAQVADAKQLRTALDALQAAQADTFARMGLGKPA